MNQAERNSILKAAKLEPVVTTECNFQISKISKVTTADKTFWALQSTCIETQEKEPLYLNPNYIESFGYTEYFGNLENDVTLCTPPLYLRMTVGKTTDKTGYVDKDGNAQKHTQAGSLIVVQIDGYSYQKTVDELTNGDADKLRKIKQLEQVDLNAEYAQKQFKALFKRDVDFDNPDDLNKLMLFMPKV